MPGFGPKITSSNELIPESSSAIRRQLAADQMNGNGSSAAERGLKGALLKRKDFIDKDEEAKSHPSRHYYFRRAETDAATVIAQCTTELAANPCAAQALYLRGTSHAKCGQHESAICDLDAVLRMYQQQGCGGGASAGASGASGKGNGSGAGAIVSQRLATSALYQRALARSRCGQLREAIADLTHVIRLDPDHLSAAYTRAARSSLRRCDRAARSDVA